MPTFMAFWQGLDIDDRLEQGLLGEQEAQHERRHRQRQIQALQQFLYRHGFLTEPAGDAQAIVAACLAYLAASSCRTVLVNLEDLWLEPHPQNVPGTWHERPNWRRKARHRLETWRNVPQVLEVPQRINDLRKQGANRS
jgi:4-alpha-glucanotransferase